MANIFKIPNKHKGILCFTHKEKEFFLSSETAFAIMQGLSRSFFIGFHYGSFRPNTEKLTFEDFCLGSKSTVSFRSCEPFRFNLTSSNFLPTCFKNLGLDRPYDLIVVSRNIHSKNLDRIMAAVRILYNQRLFYKFIFVIPSCPTESETSHYTKVIHDYKNLFTTDEQELFSIVKLDKELSFMGMSQTLLSQLYNISRFVGIFSLVEGACKVIHEGLLCGCPVICFDKLRGGGLNYLNKQNSSQFSGFEDPARHLHETFSNYDQYSVDGNYLNNNLSEVHTVPKLKSGFRRLFQQNGMEFDGELMNTDNLHRRLPAHYGDVAWNDATSPTADISNLEQLKIFIKEIKKQWAIVVDS